MAVKAKAGPKTQTSQKSPYPGVSKAKQRYAETRAPPSQEPRDHIEQAVQAWPLTFFPSGMADHALRLGPYMRRSCYQENFQHGHRWSHETWQIRKTKTQTTKNKRQDADPPARFASHHPKDSKANSERGKSPTETTTKEICQGHSGKNPLCRNWLKNMQQTS